MRKLTTCKKCGQPDLIWSQTKAGKWYLGTSVALTGEYVSVKAQYVAAHRCEDWLANLENDSRAIIRAQVEKDIAAEFDAIISATENKDGEFWANLLATHTARVESETEKRLADYLANYYETYPEAGK